MTSPLGANLGPGDIDFVNQGAAPAMPLPGPLQSDIPGNSIVASRPLQPYPKANLKIDEDRLNEFKIWADIYLREIIAAQTDQQQIWENQEKSYRALYSTTSSSIGQVSTNFVPLPFAGASTVVVPVIAMAVDPIHARLDTGIFKQDPVIKLKGLKKSVLKYIPALQEFVDYHQRHRWNLRQIFSPAMLEFCKLGTMFFSTEYENEQYQTVMYDEQFKPVTQTYTAYKGPLPKWISIGDILFPAGYQNLQDPPMVAQRIRTTLDKLRIMQASEKITDVSLIAPFEKYDRTDLELALEDAASHHTLQWTRRDIVVYRVWCDYDLFKNGLPVKLSMVYHLDTRTILSLRLNWYYNQRRPITAIPYTVTSQSIYGLGICEMVKPFQDAITSWQRMASDNAYLANIRMFIARKGSGIEEVPRLYAGRVFFVEEPKADFIPFGASDIYPSTLSERENLFGLVEKRTGVSDYLTGRESPIIGSRATATSTLALIQEGTKRVEQVLENIRHGVSEIVQNAFDIWIQYGVDDIDEMVFSDDEVGRLVKEFFDTQVTNRSVRGAIAVDLSATDASGNRQVQQQLQLSIIQIMMGYYDKLVQSGMAMLQAQQQAPQLAQLIQATQEAMRKMFMDLLQKYDIPNADDYLPDIKDYISGQPIGGGANGAGAQQPILGQGTRSSPQGPVGGPSGRPGLPNANGVPTPGTSGSAGANGDGDGSAIMAALAGAGAGS